MGQSKLVVLIPVKSTEKYQERIKPCLDTWLKDCPCDFKLLSDADMGLTEVDQHDTLNDPIRCLRTKGMAQYALDNGYEYMFRTDSDAFVWIERLLQCGFEKYDYVGHCADYPPEQEKHRTAHGGVGFVLSRRAMEIVAAHPVSRCSDGRYWGDIWAGEVLYENGIKCYNDKRFVDGAVWKGPGHGDVWAEDLPQDHPYISIHPVNPLSNYYDLHEKFLNISAKTEEPNKHFFEANGHPLIKLHGAFAKDFRSECLHCKSDS